MPAYKYHGMLVFFAAHREHIGFYPGSTTVNVIFRDELKNYQTSKGTIKFPLHEDLPLELIKKIIRFRAEQNLGMEALKIKKKK